MDQNLDLFERPDRPMSKAEARHKRRAERQNQDRSSTTKPLEARSPRQAELISHLKAHRPVIAIGDAGTGKTYVAARSMARAMINGEIDKIIVSRVAVSIKKHALGFLPGRVEAKMEPWLIPVIDGIRAEVSAATLDKWKQEKKFEIVPFEHMRGRTFADAGVLLDEAQNASLPDMQLFLTRIGEPAMVAITGDINQIDVEDSGLADVVEMVFHFDIPMEVVRFLEEDVVRSKFAKAWVKAFASRKRSLERRFEVVAQTVADMLPDSDVTFLDAAPAFFDNGLNRAA